MLREWDHKWPKRTSTCGAHISDAFAGLVIAALADLGRVEPRQNWQARELTSLESARENADVRHNRPTPEDVDAMEQALEANGKTFEFHRYDGAGHAFFSVDRPSYDLEATKDGWKQIWSFLGRLL